MRSIKVRRGLRWVRIIQTPGHDGTVMVADVLGKGGRYQDGSCSTAIGVLVMTELDGQPTATTFIPGTTVDLMLGEEEERTCCEPADPPCDRDNCDVHHP